MTTLPRDGEAVHYVEHRGNGCTLVVVRGATHHTPGDAGQWCISIDFNGWGHREHVPHGHERGHWHHRHECEHL